MLRITVNANLDIDEIIRRQQVANKEAQFALDNQVLKDSNYFAPEDLGYAGGLKASSLLHSRLGQGHIEWNTPYARRLYYNPQYNFSKDKNPNAQGLWFEAAKAVNKNNWVDVAQKSYDKYFG
ncbi:minor capsid protein [Bacillus sp. 7586-K]|nr:minor capsid protein [Bacillus sp. 7586-K]